MFIRNFDLSNEVRFFYGGQGNNISIGSNRDESKALNKNVYRNTNDFIGLGLTYKWLDGDISYSIRATTYLKEERSNLSQFKLSAGFSSDQLFFRGYFNESEGVVLSGAYDEFSSEASLHEVRLGLEVTYVFNQSKYSYRASVYQNESQQKTAGSLLLRVVPFYRNLGSNQGSMIPVNFDNPQRFGDQAGLKYIKAPGILIMPGYGINIVIHNSNWFVSPIIFAGMGLANNHYRTVGNEKTSYNNAEFVGCFNLNAGYNSSAFYSKIQLGCALGYSQLNPSFITTTNLTATITCGVRFKNLTWI